MMIDVQSDEIAALRAFVAGKKVPPLVGQLIERYADGEEVMRKHALAVLITEAVNVGTVHPVTIERCVDLGETEERIDAVMAAVGATVLEGPPPPDKAS